MKLKLFEGPRQSKNPFPSVSIYAKMQRLNFNTKAVSMLNEIAGNEVEYVRIYFDEEDPDVFYVAPSQKAEPGSRRLARSSLRGRFLEGKALLAELRWKINTLTVLRVLKTPDGSMLLIDKKEEA